MRSSSARGRSRKSSIPKLKWWQRPLCAWRQNAGRFFWVLTSEGCWFTAVRGAICFCSHQGGNRDSGVYSSDSSSSGFHPGSQQTSTGSDVFWTDVCDLDKPKMDAKTAGLLVGDEGVSDVCT